MQIAQAGVPTETWMVVEPDPSGQVRPVSQHATQAQAEAERDRKNGQLQRPRYAVCFAFEPVAAGMGRSCGH